MSTWQVINRETSEVVYAYTSDTPVEWEGMEFSLFNHVKAPEVVESTEDTSEWRLFVGSFFDRFGSDKIAILASSDSFIMAVIKDASVRKYIDIKARRDELAYALNVIKDKGFNLDVDAILDTKPTGEEVWQPFTL